MNDCKCGRNRQPVMKYVDHATGERQRYCYYCEPSWAMRDHGPVSADYKPSYPKGKKL